MIICKPESSHSQVESKLFWFITKNGEFYKCNEAWNDSTSFLSFEERGEYTVTLITDWNEKTGEYTPISNTIKYNKPKDGLMSIDD